MQLDERMLSSGDVTSLVKNALSPCVSSVQHEHLTIALWLSSSHVQSNDNSSSRKSSNCPFWSTTCYDDRVRSELLRTDVLAVVLLQTVIRSLRWLADKCAGLSDILYPGTLDENSCFVLCIAFLPLQYTLHFTRITFTFITLIDMSDSCIFEVAFDENPSSDPTLLDLLKLIL